MFSGRIGATSRYCMVSILPRRSFSASTPDQSVMIDGRKIAYTIIGNGPHNVLFLPGALGSYKTDFQPQLDGFDRSAFTLVGWDPPGYGGSRPPDRNFNGHFFRRDAELAYKLMKTLDKDRYSVIGWSDGGITGLIMAGSYATSIRRLVVLAGNAYVTAKDVELCEGISDLSKWSDRMRAPFLKMYGEEYFQKMWADWLKAYMRFHTDSPDGDICKKDVANIRCDTLLIHGSKDVLVPEEHCQYLHKQITNSQLVVLPEGKHNLHLKYANQFNTMVQEFLLKPEK